MKKFIKRILKGILYFFSSIISVFTTKWIRRFFNVIVCAINSRNFEHQVKRHGKNIHVGRHNLFEGLENVEIGSDFGAGDGLWLGTYPKYGGVKNNPHIKIGNNFGCSRNVHFGAINSITIGDNVLIGSNVLIEDHSHGKTFDYSKPRNKLPLYSKGDIVIGNNVWICENVIICPGVHIGNNCVIGGGTVVTKSFKEDNVLIAGNPARIVKRIEKE